MVAEKSYNKRIIGDFSKAVGAIPVSRPQDKARAGPGMARVEGRRLLGDSDTRFTHLEKGDLLRLENTADTIKLKEIISDCEGIIADDPLAEKQLTTGTLSQTNSSNHLNSMSNRTTRACSRSPLLEEQNNWLRYDILSPVDQQAMFAYVHKALAEGQSIGIFPEGGSHDNTDLLPLKAGVAAIALGVLDKYEINVPIIPVGLNYFRGHHFRGRAVVEFGEPMQTTREVLHMYRNVSKRAAYAESLKQIAEGMRNVIVTASDYHELKLIHTVRRLWQRPSSREGSTKYKQDLARRFSAGYKMVKERYKIKAQGEDGEEYFRIDFPPDLRILIEKVEIYQNTLDKWGLRDYQLMQANLEVSYSKLLYTFLHGAMVLALASIPSLILNAPVGFAANYYANEEARKDLKASRVKLAARDVLLSKKIIFSIVAVPALWIFYAILLILFSPLKARTVFVLFLCCPVFSYIGVMAVQAGIVDIKDLRPAYLRLSPAFRREMQTLPRMRLALQKEVRAIVKRYGPELGALYYSDTWDISAIKRSASAKEF